jgi:hypothetical protein
VWSGTERHQEERDGKKMIDSGMKGEIERFLSINLYKIKWWHEEEKE